MLYPKLPKRAKARRQAYIGNRPVSIGDLRAYVLQRDGLCILTGAVGLGHRCRGRFDSRPYHDRDFTLEHVIGVHGPTDVRRDDDAHCVALCHATNIDHTTKAERAVIRDRLVTLFPVCIQSTRDIDG